MGNQGVSSLRSRGCAANGEKAQGETPITYSEKTGGANIDKRKKYAANHWINDMFCRKPNKP